MMDDPKGQLIDPLMSCQMAGYQLVVRTTAAFCMMHLT